MDQAGQEQPFSSQAAGTLPSSKQKSPVYVGGLFICPTYCGDTGDRGGGQFRSHLPEVLAMTWEEFATFTGLELTTTWFLSDAAF